MNEEELEWFLVQHALSEDKRRYYHLFCSQVALQTLLSKKGLLTQEELDENLSKARLYMKEVILKHLKQS